MIIIKCMIYEVWCINRSFSIMKEAIQHIRPSALREIAVTVPNV